MPSREKQLFSFPYMLSAMFAPSAAVRSTTAECTTLCAEEERSAFLQWFLERYEDDLFHMADGGEMSAALWEVLAPLTRSMAPMQQYVESLHSTSVINQRAAPNLGVKLMGAR